MIKTLEKVLRATDVDFASYAVVLDVGSRDGLQAIELSGLFPNAQIVAIECNRETLAQCRSNLAPHSRIRLVDKAINSYTGRCDFYTIDTERTVTSWKDGNPGASSLFVANGEYPLEQYVQNKVVVDCIRLDDLCVQLCIDAVDFIWMDLQGAELLALESAGVFLQKVRYIYTEVSHRPIYHGQCLFDDVESFLTAHGFRRVSQIDPRKWQQNALYQNTRELIDAMISLPNDDDRLDWSVRSIRSFVQDVRHIYVVGVKNPETERARFIEAGTLPFDPGAVARIIGSELWAKRYFRQLVELHLPLSNRGLLKHVLTIAPDTVFLRPCRFVDGHRPIFNFGDTYHEPHFQHMRRLVPTLHRIFAYSGITHTMLYTQPWLKELHDLVEAQHPSVPFWRSYLDAVDSAESEDGASAHELYFNFCLQFYAGDLTIRRFSWQDGIAPDTLQSNRLDYVKLARS